MSRQSDPGGQGAPDFEGHALSALTWAGAWIGPLTWHPPDRRLPRRLCALSPIPASSPPSLDSCVPAGPQQLGRPQGAGGRTAAACPPSMFEQPRGVKSATYALPGVLWITAGELAQRFREIPHDAIIVLSLLPVTHSCGKGAVRASEAGDAPSQRRITGARPDVGPAPSDLRRDGRETTIFSTRPAPLPRADSGGSPSTSSKTWTKTRPGGEGGGEGLHWERLGMLVYPSRDFAYLLPRPPGGHHQTDRTPFFNQDMTPRSRRQR